MDKNLRTGHLAEDLGVLLLRQCAAVAVVRQQDDVGIDAVATILSRHSGRRLIAENAFYVQFKSCSVRTISYIDEKASWLRALQLPFFIGSVNTKKGNLALYTTHNIWRTLIETECSEIHLHLDPLESSQLSTPGIHRICLGKPVITWSLADAGNPDFVERLNNVLRSWVEMESSNIDLRRFQFVYSMNWETGEPPTHGGDIKMSNVDTTKGLVKDLKEIRSIAEKLIFSCCSTGSMEDLVSIAALIGLFRRHNVTIDEKNTFELLLRSRLKELGHDPDSNWEGTFRVSLEQD